MAARAGGGNPDGNLRLKMAIAKARENSMPADKIKSAIQRGTGEVEGVNYSSTRANFRVENDGRARAVSAERRFYSTASAPTTEVGILSGFDGDLYIARGESIRDGGGAWTVRLYHNPLVQLIFIGAVMMAVGGLLSLIALARRKERTP